MMKQLSHTGIRVVINLLLAVGVTVGCLLMAFGGIGLLRADGFGGLKYFTVQSNLLEGVASVLWLICIAVRGRETHWVAVLKYIACACVGLTFLTVMLFLGPLYGYPSMFQRANLFFHLLVPLLAMAEFLLMNREKIGVKENLAVVAAPLLYGTVYLVNVLVREPTDDPYAYDLYGFLLWGLPVGIAIFAVICLLTFLIGLGLRLGSRAITANKQTD